MSARENDLGVFFQEGLQLNKDFCEKMSLVRPKGFLEDGKYNIKAIKLRGEKSEGLFIPYDSVKEAIESLGMQLCGEGSKLGEPLCKKYVPKSNRVNNSENKSNNKKKKKLEVPLFEEHIETEQLAYNLGAFKPGDLIEITLKQHGCFKAGTKVRMADGSLKRIQKINVGEKVLGYNFDTKTFEPTTVLNTFKNAPSSNWRKLKFSRDHIQGDKRGVTTATHNHPFWSEEYGCWIEAENLKVGDKISCLFPSPILTSMQKELAVGMILGDGCLLTFGEKTAEISHCSKHEEYTDFINSIFNGYFKKEDRVYISGYGTKMHRGRTTRSADLYNNLKDSFTFSNKSGENKLLDGIVDMFSVYSLLMLYLDDGHLKHNDAQRDRAGIAICDYNDNDSKIICKCLEKFGINPVLYKDSGGYNRIRLNTKSAYIMFNLIKDYVPSCMRYKLPKEFRDEPIKTINDPDKYIPNGYVFSQQTVLMNKIDNKTYTEYDIETSLHNYIVGMNVVHNTSQRSAYLPVVTGYKKNILDILFRRQGNPVVKYNDVCGTRRVVLDTFDRENPWYGNNKFREAHHNRIIAGLNKGEEIYYEIVGWSDDNTTIMPVVDNKKVNDKEFIKKYGKNTVFSYGCKQGESKMFVYRMTMTNEDGDAVEYSPDFMRYRCEQMCLDCVPVLWKGYIPEKEELDSIGVSAGEWIKRIAEQYYDGADPIGFTHIREGVVVRIVNRPKFTAFKHKNFYFKVLSGIATSNLSENSNYSEDVINEI